MERSCQKLSRLGWASHSKKYGVHSLLTGKSVRGNSAACSSLLSNLDGLTASLRTAAFAAIGLIGPRAKELLMEIDLNPSGVVIQEALGCYEVILPSERGPELWEYLLEAGAPFGLACVGHDALDRLAAAHRFERN